MSDLSELRDPCDPCDPCDPLELWNTLQTLLREKAASRPLLIAFSGGLDSRFTAFAARAALGNRVALHNHVALHNPVAGGEPTVCTVAPGDESPPEIVLVHVVGPHIPGQESVQAQQWALACGFALHVVEVNPLGLAALAKGDRDRCYHCKRAMFEALFQAGAALFPGRLVWVCDGTNASDLTTYRPGLRALRELGVCSPLAETGIIKAQVRHLARHLGMDHPDQQARPCLLTRLEYGLAPTEALLRQVEQAEQCAAAALAALLCTRNGGLIDATKPVDAASLIMPAISTILLRPANIVNTANTANSDDSELPDFRVRVNTEGLMTLHVNASWSSDAVHALQRDFNARLRAVFPVLQPVQVLVGGPVSGYFDRQSPLQP